MTTSSDSPDQQLRKLSYFRKVAVDQKLHIIDNTSSDVSLAQLDNSFQDLLEIVVQSYVTGWYPDISPRDRSFLPHLYQLLLGVLHSLGMSISSPRTMSALDELLLLDVPYLLERHLESWNRAERDVLEMTTVSEGFDTRQISPAVGLHAVSDRYNLLRPHLGIQRSIEPEDLAPSPPQTALPATVSPSQSLDISLNEAMSSSMASMRVRPAPIIPFPMTTNQGRSSPRPMIGETKSNASPEATWQTDPRYLTTLSRRLLSYHLPTKDYASTTERAIVVEILASAILANTIKKLSQGWMLTKLFLAIIGEPELNIHLAQDQARTSVEATGITSVIWAVYHSAIFVIYKIAAFLLAISHGYTILLAHWNSACVSKPSVKQVDGALKPLLSLFSTMLNPGHTEAPSRRTVQYVWNWVEMAFSSVVLGRFTDRLLPFYLHKHVFTATTTDKVVRKLTDVLFPDGYPAPSVPDPSDAEISDMERRLVARLDELFPGHVKMLLFGRHREQQMDGIRRILAPFQDSNVTVNLIVRLLEAILLTIEPRLEHERR